MAVRECTWCRFVRIFHPENFAEELIGYINALPEDLRTSEEEHARRLAACAECPGNREGLCRYCGCYVAARAAKKNLSCPDPAGARW